MQAWGRRNSRAATADRAEVCPLSRQAMFQPVSRPLQPGVHFFRIPLPTAPTAFLAVRLPLPAALWAYPVPHESPSGADPSSSPAADRPWWPSFQRPLLTAYRFGSSLSARLACSAIRFDQPRSRNSYVHFAEGRRQCSAPASVAMVSNSIRLIGILQPAIAGARQREFKFFVDKPFDQPTSLGADAGFDRAKPVVEKLARDRCGGLNVLACRDIVSRGVVSFAGRFLRQAIRGFSPRRLCQPQVQPTPRRHPPQELAFVVFSRLISSAPSSFCLTLVSC